jgi:hypothetical protein
MCFMKAPKPAPAPTPPATRDGDSAEMRAREEEDRRRARQSQGRRSTILTSGTGAAGFDQVGGRATLLGQSNGTGRAA